MQADFSVELGHDDPMLELPWASDDPSVRYYDLKNCPELVWQIPEAVANPELSAFLARMNAQDSPFETAKCDLWQSREISAEEEVFGAEQKFVSYIDLVFVNETVRGSFEKHEKFAGELCQLLNRAPDMAATIELIIRRCYYRPRKAQQREVRQDQQIDKYAPSDRDTPSDRDMPSERDMQAEKDVQTDTSKDESAAVVEYCGEMPSTRMSHSLLMPHGDRPRMQEQERDGCGSDSLSTGFYLTAYVSGFGDGDQEPRQKWSIAMALLRHVLVQLSS